MTIEVSEGSTPDEKRYYSTSDISHAAAIIASGNELIDVRSKIDKRRGRSSIKSEFVFKKPGVEKLLIDYSNNNLQVDAKTLLDTLRNLKAVGVGKVRN